MSGPFAKITNGPAQASGVDTNKIALIYDQQNGIVEAVPVSGTMQALQTALAVLTAQTALTNVTTAQNLMNIVLNAGVLNKKLRTLLISGTGVFSTAGTPQITIAVVVNTVTVVSIQTPAIGAAQANGQFTFQFTIQTATTGTGATMEAHGSIQVQGGATLATAVPSYNDQNTAVSSAVNLVAAGSMQVTIAATATLTSVTLRQGTVEVLN